MSAIIPILIVTVAVATVLNIAFKFINLPTVIGYIFTGVIIGSLFDIHVQSNETLEHIAEFGVVFLMFTIGLEFSVKHLLSMKKEVFLFGLLQVILTGAVLTLAAQFMFGIQFKSAIIVGAALALSSTAIVLKILNESRQIKTSFGSNSLGILIFQDIAVIPILLMITIFTSQDKSLSQLLTETALNVLIVLGILVLFGKYVLSRLFKIVSDANSKEIYMGMILFTVVGASYTAHHFGFSYSLGGFIAGMMIADTIYKYQVEADLIPFRDLLLGVFFISVGLQIDLNVVSENVVDVVILGLMVMAVKAAMIVLIMSFATDMKTALKTGLTLAQVGEFSLVVFSLLLANQMLDPTSIQVVMVAIVLSMISTPVLINNLDRIIRIVFREGTQDTIIDHENTLGEHVILCGYGSFGRVVSDRLDDAGIDHTIVTSNTDNFVKAKEADKTIVFGDPADQTLLRRLQIESSMSTILALDDFDAVKRVSAAITLIDKSLKIISRVPTEKEKAELSEFNHELLLDGNSQTASLIVEQITSSSLLAKETTALQYLGDFSVERPREAIDKVEREQARLLNVMSKSFNGLREDKGIMYIKAFHDSFKILSKIIGNAIVTIISSASLSPKEYERINILLANQDQLVALNNVLEDLGKELDSLSRHEMTASLSHMAVEGLDTILLSLMDIANDYSDEDMVMLESMTSEEGGLSRIRESYLGAETGLEAGVKALLMSATNHMDRLRSLFRSVGENHRKLAQGGQ
jgi:CPA2 family monovalent cation:H+ antiporter-2